MSGVDDLVAFVRARIAEERADAEAATDETWVAETDDDGEPVVTFHHATDYIRHVAEPSYDADARHIARQDPAATLARCDALTALVDLHKPEWFAGGPPHGFGDDVCALCGTVTTTGDLDGEWPCESLKLIAAIWRDHADYRPEWSAT